MFHVISHVYAYYFYWKYEEIIGRRLKSINFQASYFHNFSYWTLNTLINLINLKSLLFQLHNLSNDGKDENNDLPNSRYKDREYFSTLSNNMK